MTVCHQKPKIICTNDDVKVSKYGYLTFRVKEVLPWVEKTIWGGNNNFQGDGERLSSRMAPYQKWPKWPKMHF